MFRLRRAIYDIENRISIERSEVQDTEEKLLDEYRSQNEDLKKVNSDLQKDFQKAQDSFNTEKQGFQERIALLGKHFSIIWFEFVLMETI